MMNNNNNGAIVSRGDDLSPDHGDDGGSSSGLKKGPWTAAEDAILMEYVKKHGEGNWNAVQKNSGLFRCGKSCRLRWANHLRPNLKKGSFTVEEENLILELHAKLGNKWARMAAQLPGRTDNEIKNYWNTRIKRRQRAGLPLYPQDIQKQAFHLHHQNQSRPALTPPPPLTPQFPSSQQRRPNFSSPLSLFNPPSFSTTSFLPSQFHDFKRFRGNNNFGFNTPFSLSNNPQPQSSLFTQNLCNQLQPTSTLRFNSSNFDLNPPPVLHTAYEPDGLVGSGSSFPMRVPQLPSIQVPEQVAHTANLDGTDDYKITKSNSGLLDALLEEAQAMASSEDSKREKKPGLDQLVNDAPVSESVFSQNASSTPLISATQSSFEMKMKDEPEDEINSVDDDLSRFLDIMPPTLSMAEWGYSDSGEISNGQSSGEITEDEIGLEMKPSVPATNASDQDFWNITNWNNLPGIC